MYAFYHIIYINILGVYYLQNLGDFGIIFYSFFYRRRLQSFSNCCKILLHEYGIRKIHLLAGLFSGIVQGKCD